MQDKHSKTEQATPKRLRDSKRKGQTAKSGDLNSAVSFLIFALLLGSLGRYLLVNSAEMVEATLKTGIGNDLSYANAGVVLIQIIERFFYIFLPFGIIAVALGVFTNLVQVGFIFSIEPIKPDFKRLNPVEGFKNIFSQKAVFNMFKSILKLIVVSFITYKGLQDVIRQILNSGQIGTENLFYFFIEIIRSLSINIAVLMLGLAIIDLIFQKKEFKKNMMMTKQEIKDEYKQMEGDPKIKSARQQRQRELSMSRTMQSVEESSVIITNPTHIAIALRYEQGKDQAPVVMAKGLDYMAQKIKEKAREVNVPVVENKPLARAMYHKVDPGDHVPVEMYQAIAEILAFVYKLKEKNKGKI
ncbi:flagellar biosynthesis protein FlhB [Alkalibacter mobilis]|uniref:flagellar biosynthesis protein FlhB n=1 Tax=Alkalibacter mobilis TaxID=2787712 RepID=UPI00189EDDFC|nr:flagellar biosynthesis protein FlhB [Alkalibacter mobilis]